MMTDYGIDVCPVCKNTGWELFVDENGCEQARECKCGFRQREIQQNRLRFAAIPKTYRDVSLREWTTRHYTGNNKMVAKATAESVKNWLEKMDSMIQEGKGFYFWSETKGSGKTMLAAAIANELIHKYKRFVKFATSLDILDEIRATYDRNNEENENRLLDDLVSADFLVIDDFGTERASDWAGEKFYQIVNKRYINKKVTFYTSNYDLKTLKYDDRIQSRIRERSFIVHFPEESVREVKAMKENVVTGQTE